MSLGTLEQQVLAAVNRLGDDAYGLRLAEEIARVRGREIGTEIYTILKRLDEKGFVSWTWEERARTTAGNPNRKVYRVTAAGYRALREVQESVS